MTGDHFPPIFVTSDALAARPNALFGWNVPMKVKRNHLFLIGVLFVMLGIQFRMIDSFVLNENTTRTLAKVSHKAAMAPESSLDNLMLQAHPNPTKRIQPPRWLGLAMIAVGSVVSLHALAMPRQE